MLRFWFGASGSGKSTGVYKEVIKKSIEDPGTNYLIIVPDQFTMQTQKDVVLMHPRRTIMNIDVLSFGRLSHRVFEETGHGSFTVLDDVGKSLVLRHVSDMLGDRLPVIGSSMHRSGYIDEVKSTISEFMMYGISDTDLSVLEEKCAKKGALSAKLKDLRLLYSEFLKYIEGKYITTEETLDILCRAIPSSELIRESVIVFDGFTGFTPIQYRVIKKLLSCAKEVTFTLTISPGEDPYGDFKEQELFMLTKKTVRDLERLEFELQREKGSDISGLEAFRKLRQSENRDVFIRDETVIRHVANRPLAYLEKALFRYDRGKFKGENGAVCIYEASTQSEEIRQTMIKISGLIREGGLAYRDIALVCGSLEDYKDKIQKAAEKFDIPVYIDENSSILLNPFVEYITSALSIVSKGYRYEDVFHYLRSGLTRFEPSDVDLLENYVRALGIKGKNRWEDKFLKRMPKRFKPGKSTKKWGDLELTNLQKMEDMRKRIAESLSPLSGDKKTAGEISSSLIKVIENEDCKNKLQSFSDMFREAGDIKKAREFEQIYDKVMALLLQIDALIGDEKLSVQEYMDVLDAGFSDITVGTIPQDVDRIIVGDIERTRLREVKALFLVGVNDGNIPSSVGGGGILSDIDRQFLSDLGTDIELAPTPRQQMYIQRLYLYMNLTKPTDKLFLSYAELSDDGKSLRPAYLIPKVRGMFEELSIERPEDGELEKQLITKKESMEYVSSMMRRYAEGVLSERERCELFTVVRALSDKDSSEFLKKLIDAAYAHYESLPLARSVAAALYGAVLENSVSRLEQFAACAYAHFLKYGLRLSEREEFEFEAADLGNVYHEVLEKYTGQIISDGIDWKSLSKEDSDRILNEALTECVNSYGDTILRSSKRNQYMVERIRRILTRTVDTLKYQMTKTSFAPAYVEMSFDKLGSLDELDVTLSSEEKNEILGRMKLKGKIDRLDLAYDDENVYVKVMDFKSGSHRFDIASLYYGLQLQLVVYMDVACASRKKALGEKDVVPAAILYYHVEDPMLEKDAETVTDDINSEIISKLKMTGLVNDNPDIIHMLDESLTTRSDIIPVEYKKDGTLTARSQTATSQEYAAISRFAGRKIREFGRRILEGEIGVNPYETSTRDSCRYCDFRSICRYDEKIKGFRKRKLDISADDAKAAILEEDSRN